MRHSKDICFFIFFLINRANNLITFTIQTVGPDRQKSRDKANFIESIANFIELCIVSAGSSVVPHEGYSNNSFLFLDNPVS